MNRARADTVQYHTYDTLEALHNGTKANVMGVVVETTQPKETKMGQLRDQRPGSR